MSKERKNFWVFTPHGIFSADGRSAGIALRRFELAHRGWEILGIFRDDLVIKPPAPDGPAYLCAFIQGRLSPKPGPEEGEK